MADSVARTCILCLQPDEESSMVHVDMAHVESGPGRHAVICRRCAGAIAEAVAADDEPPAKPMVSQNKANKS